MWPGSGLAGARGGRREEQGHRLDYLGDVSPARAGEAYRPQLEDVRDHLRMLEATDQNLLEVLQVLEAQSRMLEAPEELKVR